MTILVALVAMLLLAGCGEPQTTSLTFECMGTTGSVKVRDGALPDLDIVYQLDSELSHWKPDSPLSQFNKAPAGAPFLAPESLVDIVLLANELCTRTDGAFDIALGSGRVTVDHDAQTLTKSKRTTRIDLSAIAKGYAIDRLAEAIASDDFLIEFGGELRAGPGGSWTAGIERKDGSGTLRRTVKLRGQSIATSGTYRLGEHIVDPRTGEPATAGVVSASVIAKTAAEADALATALMVTGKPIGSASIVFGDGKVRETGAFAP